MAKSSKWGYLSALSFALSTMAFVAFPSQPELKVHPIGAPDRPDYSEIFGQAAKDPNEATKTLATELVVVTEPTWCNPCRQLEPELEKLGKNGYKVRQVSMNEWRKEHPNSRSIRKVDEKPNDESLFKVPTLFFFSQKGEIVNKRFGYQTYALISSLMEKP